VTSSSVTSGSRCGWRCTGWRREAYINWRFGSTVLDIYVFSPAGPGLQRLYQSKGDGQWSFEEVKDGEDVGEIGPTLTVSKDMLEAIVAAAHDVLPPSAATDRHLKDAIAVRDRALAMVEVAFRPVVKR
jgi:hypothetical protein